MRRMQCQPARVFAMQKKCITSVVLLLVSAGMAATVAAQSEPGFQMPAITVQPLEGKVLVPAEIISVGPTCRSAVNITSEQRNTLARIKGTVESSSCPASHGEYTFVIAIRDENNERSTIEVSETWQRSDDAPISFVKEYPIPENVDLTRVSLRGLRCTCDELPAE